MTKTENLVVADAGVLIHLDVLNHYQAVFVPHAVWVEVEYHRPQSITA
jgi:hypothetical protein